MGGEVIVDYQPVLYSRYSMEIYDFHDTHCNREALTTTYIDVNKCAPVPDALDSPYHSMIFQLYDVHRNQFQILFYTSDDCSDTEVFRYGVRGDGCQALANMYETWYINFRIRSPIVAPCILTIFDEAGCAGEGTTPYNAYGIIPGACENSVNQYYSIRYLVDNGAKNVTTLFYSVVECDPDYLVNNSTAPLNTCHSNIVTSGTVITCDPYVYADIEINSKDETKISKPIWIIGNKPHN